MSRPVMMKAKGLPLSLRRVKEIRALPLWQRWLVVLLDWEDRIVERRIPPEIVSERLRGPGWRDAG